LSNLSACHAQAFKGLWTRHFMHEMTVNIEQTGAIGLFIHQMIVPDFVIKCAGLHWMSLFLKILYEQIAANNTAMQPC
jgi:hypothetical protein